MSGGGADNLKLSTTTTNSKSSNEHNNNNNNTDYVKLISCDDFEFIIDRKCAMASGTIKNMLSSPGQFTEAVQNEIHFKDISGLILEKVCKYLYYKVKYTNTSKESEIPEFRIEPEISLELLMASDFLDC